MPDAFPYPVTTPVRHTWGGCIVTVSHLQPPLYERRKRMPLPHELLRVTGVSKLSETEKAHKLRISWTGLDAKTGERSWGHDVLWAPKSQIALLSNAEADVSEWLFREWEKQVTQKYDLSQCGLRAWEGTI